MNDCGIISDVNMYDVMGTCDIHDYCAYASVVATYGDASVQTHQQGGRASDSQTALLTGLSKAVRSTVVPNGKMDNLWYKVSSNNHRTLYAHNEYQY